MRDETQQFRDTQRAAALSKRGGDVYARCDLCGLNPPAHYHEIITRNETRGNKKARRLSYDQRLCACICPACHEKIHGEMHTYRVPLLVHNLLLYKTDFPRMATLLHDIREALGNPTWLLECLYNALEGAFPPIWVLDTPTQAEDQRKA